MPVNLRHKLNNNDLHNTCRKQQEELSEQKIKNETMGLEFKRLEKHRETFGETLERVMNEGDSDTDWETRLVR
jgi:hypothetical protein